MAQRGRKSAESLAVAPHAAPAALHSRIPPSPHLSDAEQVVWCRVIGDQPAQAFSETHRDMLDLYCQHVVSAQVLDDEIKAFDREWLRDNEGLKRYDKLLKMREREVRSASSLATRLRITRQSVDQQTIARAMVNAPKSKKPWELTIEAG